MIAYRAATEADLPAICVLGQVVNLLHHQAWPQVFAPASAPERDELHWRQCIAGEGSMVFVAERSLELVGFVTISVATESHSLMQPMRYARVGSVCVQESERGKGVGRRLMSQAEGWALERGAAEIRLNVWAFNEAALGLYKELGYEVRSLSLGKALPQNVA
ncbi:MAG: GNAT family N-acetyltransferase [Burkholderiales bacterium]|nr:GNAT family N-acetyltransferase [Burkholderiales bacterium]